MQAATMPVTRRKGTRAKRRDRLVMAPVCGRARHPHVTGPAAGETLLTNAPARSAPAIAADAAEIVSLPPGAETCVVLDRCRLGRKDGREGDKDQEQRNRHREGRPERGRDGRSDRAIEMRGCVHAGVTRNRSVLLLLR